MKKGKGSKSKKVSKTKSKVFFDDKKLLAVSIGLFLILAVALAFVNVPQNSSSTGKVVKGIDISEDNDIIGKIGTFLTNFINPEKVDPVVLKWVIFFTFTLLIWAVLSSFTKTKKSALLKLLSLPVAFAMVYFLKPEEIFAGLIGYSALGMTVIVVGPFLAIVFFSAKLLQGRLTAIKIISQLMVWYFYLAFLIYFLVRAFFATETYSLWIILIIAIGIIISLFIIIKNKGWRKLIAKFEREGVAKGIEDVQSALGTKERAEAERAKSQGEDFTS